MGSAFCSHDFGRVKKEDLPSLISKLEQQLRYEHGNDDYAGHLGNNSYRILNERIFDSHDEMVDYIQDHGKTGVSIVAAYRVSKQEPESAKATRIKNRNVVLINIVDQLNTDHHTLLKDLVQRAKAAKSKTRGCKACGSMIATQYINKIICPVCNSNAFIITATDQKKIDSIKAKTVKAQAELSSNRATLEDDLKSRIKPTSEVGWFIAGWCSV